MSVKSKVKRLNRKIAELEQEIDSLEKMHSQEKKMNSGNVQLYENIIKFALTKHIGRLRLRCGMLIDKNGVDKMSELNLDIEYNCMENAYFMRVV